MIKPISPEEIVTQNNLIPDEIIETINEFLIDSYQSKKYGLNNNKNAQIKLSLFQNTLVSVLIKKGLNRKEIFQNHWLDFEDLYRSEGWKVDYFKQPYYEIESSYWTFSK